MKIEYLVAYDDNRWDTITVDVPLETEDREKLVAWAEENLARQTQYRNTVQFGLYHIVEDDEDQDRAIDRLLKHAEDIDACETSLDEVVIDCKTAEASNVNNGGLQAQIQFLLDSGLDEAEIKDSLIGSN